MTAAVSAVARTDRAVWARMCRVEALLPERGAPALVDGEQVALFRTWDGELFAVGNRDPFSGAQVMARGVVGTRGGTPTVASPMHKQVFDLRSGRCLDDDSVALPVWMVRLVDGWLEVRR